MISKAGMLPGLYPERLGGLLQIQFYVGTSRWLWLCLAQSWAKKRLQKEHVLSDHWHSSLNQCQCPVALSWSQVRFSWTRPSLPAVRRCRMCFESDSPQRKAIQTEMQSGQVSGKTLVAWQPMAAWRWERLSTLKTVKTSGGKRWAIKLLFPRGFVS